MSEQEEFEFRHRLEQEQAVRTPAAPAEPAAEPSTLSKAGELAKQFFITGHPSVPGHESIEPSVGQNLAYPGGVISTAAVQGAKSLAGKGSAEDMKAAIAGNAKSVPQQLQESGWPAAAAYGVGIPLQVATDPLADFASAPAQAAVNPVAQYIGNRVKQGAENFATTPVFDKVSQATNLVGKGKDIIGKIAESTKDALPESLKPGADLATGLAGRAAVYKTPLAPVQAVSDVAKGASFAQKGVAKALDWSKSSKAVQTLSSSNLFSESQLSRITASPFFQTLENAGKAGGSDAVATTHYVLQQTDPAYQKLLKDEQGGDNGVQK